MPPLARPPSPAAALAIVAAGPAPAATPGEGPCAALTISGKPVEHAFKLPGGQRAALRDPYGGLIFRNRLFVSFAVRTASTAQRRKLIDHVEWRLDDDASAFPRNRGGAYALQV